MPFGERLSAFTTYNTEIILISRGCGLKRFWWLIVSSFRGPKMYGNMYLTAFYVFVRRFLMNYSTRSFDTPRSRSIEKLPMLHQRYLSSKEVYLLVRFKLLISRCCWVAWSKNYKFWKERWEKLQRVGWVAANRITFLNRIYHVAISGWRKYYRRITSRSRV